MLKLINALLVIILIASQAFRLPVLATADTSQSNIVTNSAPSFDLTVCKIALEQDLRRIERKYHVVPGVILYAHNISVDEANRLATEGVMLGFNSTENFIDLQIGNILLIPEKDIVVSTNKGAISIGAGATVFISACSDELVVYDLLQTKPKQVAVTIDNCKVIMQPGAVLAATRQNIDNFEQLELNKNCMVYSSPQHLPIKNSNAKAFIANFSIANALTAVQPLQRLTVSNHPEDKLALGKVIKGAILMDDFNPEDMAKITNFRSEKIAKAGQGNQ